MDCFRNRQLRKVAETIGFPGASPVVSANGTTNGIVWVAETRRVFVEWSRRCYGLLMRQTSRACFTPRIWPDDTIARAGGEICGAGGDQWQSLRGRAERSGCVRPVQRRDPRGLAHVQPGRRILCRQCAGPDFRFDGELYDLLHHRRQRALDGVGPIFGPDYDQFADDVARRLRPRRDTSECYQSATTYTISTPDRRASVCSCAWHLSLGAVGHDHRSRSHHLLHDGWHDADAQFGTITPHRSRS